MHMQCSTTNPAASHADRETLMSSYFRCKKVCNPVCEPVCKEECGPDCKVVCEPVDAKEAKLNKIAGKGLALITKGTVMLDPLSEVICKAICKEKVCKNVCTDSCK